MNVSIVLLSVIGTATCLASPFQNLNFDSANTNNLVGDPPRSQAGTTADLLPGWQLRDENSVLLSGTGFDYYPPGRGYTTLISPSFDDSYPVVGAYSFAMAPYQDVQGAFEPYTLSQTGDLAADILSIRFLSYGTPVSLTANGSIIDLIYTPIVGEPGWNPFVPVFEAVGDLAPFAGQTVDLAFTALRTPNLPGYVVNGLDEITLSTIPVPEPATFALLALGGVALLRLRSRRSREASA